MTPDALVGKEVVVELPGGPRVVAPGFRPLAVDEIWLEDVAFGEGPSLRGRVHSSRPRRLLEKSGWEAVRYADGGFWAARTGTTVRRARYAWVGPGQIRGFGLAEHHGTGVEGRDLPVYGPTRRAYRGEMGGLNYEIASDAATAAAVHWVLERHPGCVIVDGSDDWHAPERVHPPRVVRRHGITPLAWWHTGKSGQSHSGVVLDERAFGRFRQAYRRQCGVFPEDVGPPARLSKGECGCWVGDGLRIYFLRRPDHLRAASA